MNHADACAQCTTWCYLTPLGWYCNTHGFVGVYDPVNEPPDDLWAAEHLHATPTRDTAVSSVHGAGQKPAKWVERDGWEIL